MIQHVDGVLFTLHAQQQDATNLLVPVCASASHTAYATVRMEPQFMILGHAAGVVAALTVKAGTEAHVQDVSPAAVASVLLADGQLLSPAPVAPKKLSYGCQVSSEGKRCLLGAKPSADGNTTTCGGECSPLQPHQWLALKAHYFPAKADTNVLRSRMSTVLKKSLLISGILPESAKQNVGVVGGTRSITLHLSRPPQSFNTAYWLVSCAQQNCSAVGEITLALYHAP